jgi:hypothetical protein
MNWLRFILENWQKIVKIRVEYDLITKGGKTILTISEEFVPDAVIIRNYGDFKWKLWEEDILAIYRERIEEKAEQLLTKFRKVQRNKLDKCFLYGGDYIVKCDWDVFKETQTASYKECKNLDEGK